MSSDQVITLVAFAFYLVLMVAIGVFYSKRTKNNEDYFLGGRNLGGWTAALSAQASDMSGWLLMGLPGAVYLAGTGEVWIAIGLLIGTILNWFLVASRLRKYTIVAGNSLTIPSFFENRYRDKTGVIKIISAVIIAICCGSDVNGLSVLTAMYIAWSVLSMRCLREPSTVAPMSSPPISNTPVYSELSKTTYISAGSTGASTFDPAYIGEMTLMLFFSSSGAQSAER